VDELQPRSQPSSTGTVIGTTPASESTVYTAGASTQTTTAIMSRTSTHKWQSACHGVVQETPCVAARYSLFGRLDIAASVRDWPHRSDLDRSASHRHTHRRQEARTSDDRDRDPDRGGGIAGASAAFHLAGHGRRVVLLERGEIASGASA
jgi:hypothetical protein